MVLGQSVIGWILWHNRTGVQRKFLENQCCYSVEVTTCESVCKSETYFYFQWDERSVRIGYRETMGGVLQILFTTPLLVGKIRKYIRPERLLEVETHNTLALHFLSRSVWTYIMEHQYHFMVLAFNSLSSISFLRWTVNENDKLWI